MKPLLKKLLISIMICLPSLVVAQERVLVRIVSVWGAEREALEQFFKEQSSQYDMKLRYKYREKEAQGNGRYEFEIGFNKDLISQVFIEISKISERAEYLWMQDSSPYPQEIYSIKIRSEGELQKGIQEMLDAEVFPSFFSKGELAFSISGPSHKIKKTLLYIQKKGWKVSPYIVPRVSEYLRFKIMISSDSFMQEVEEFVRASYLDFKFIKTQMESGKVQMVYDLASTPDLNLETISREIQRLPGVENFDIYKIDAQGFLITKNVFQEASLVLHIYPKRRSDLKEIRNSLRGLEGVRKTYALNLRSNSAVVLEAHPDFYESILEQLSRNPRIKRFFVMPVEKTNLRADQESRSYYEIPKSPLDRSGFLKILTEITCRNFFK